MTAFDATIGSTKQPARWRHALRRVLVWLVPLVVSAAIVVIGGGIAQGVKDEVGFVSPFNWFDGRALARLTGALSVIFVGTWLSAVGLSVLRRVLAIEALTKTPLASVVTIARAGLDEVLRNKTVAVLLAILFVVLAGQPFFAQSTIEQPLRYKIQTFLTFSGLLGFLLLGAITIFLSASAVSGDLEGRRGGDVFVKPVPRWAYLIGRWLGVALPSALLVGIWAILTYGIATLWLSPQPEMDDVDRDYVNNRVLVSRQEAKAGSETSFQQAAQERLAEVRRTDPDRLTRRGTAEVLSDLLNEQRVNFLKVEAGPGNGNTYRFAGLLPAREAAMELDAQLRADADEIAQRLSEAGITLDDGQAIRPGQIGLDTVLGLDDIIGRDLSAGRLQLRFKVRGVNTYGGTDGDLVLSINENIRPVRYVVDRVQIYDVPATFIDENGIIDLGIENFGTVRQGVRQAVPIQFEADVWLSLFFTRDNFAGNMLRQAIVLWVRLAFLGMLATCAASMLTFSVATVFSLASWVLLAGGEWLQTTLGSGLNNTGAGVTESLVEDTLLRAVFTLSNFLSTFSQVNGMSRISNGLYVPWEMVLQHTLWVGLVWTSAVFLFGWLLFSRREIARVQV